MMRKILLVEDDPAVRHLCRSVLTREGFEIIMAHHGAEGLAIYKERKEEIDLIVSDVTMPEMGGFEMIRNIFAISPQTKVIMMSGFGWSDGRFEELAKLCATIEKPFMPPELIEVVKKCLDPSLLS
jgi:DNA-binding NtrC family response regulator